MKNEGNFAIYSRKSKLTEKGESIENQTELCKKYIINHYGESASSKILLYEDEGFSGGNTNRPDFKRMMNDARNHRLSAIVVYRLDRISRSISDFSYLIDELAHLDIAFISIKEQFDTSSPMGRAMMYIASVFSQLERETIAERIRDNMCELAKTGRWLGGITPTGYESEAIKTITIDGKTKKSCKLRLIPIEADTIKTIYRLYLQTQSLTQTETELRNLGLFSKNGNHFTRFSIRSILQNPVYLIADINAYDFFLRSGTSLYSEIEAFDGIHGIMAYNRTQQERGHTTKHLPMDQWIISVGKHTGLISGTDWIQVQQYLARNRTARNNAGHNCAVCNCADCNRVAR